MRPARYTVSARFYDVLSLEWPIYRTGRIAAVAAMGLRPGMRVLDLACGTGLNHPLLMATVGPRGRVIGLDASPQMLRQARRRADRHGWDNLDLHRVDIAELGVADIDRVDAVIATYALSLVPRWERAWAQALASTRPGGRLAVVDLQRPTGAARMATPLALIACAAGGADIDAHPWRVVERDCTHVTAAERRGGHIQIRVGTRP